MARKPSALARELVRNFPKGRRRRKARNPRSGGKEKGAAVSPNGQVQLTEAELDALEAIDSPGTGELLDPSELEEQGVSIVDVEDE